MQCLWKRSKNISISQRPGWASRISNHSKNISTETLDVKSGDFNWISFVKIVRKCLAQSEAIVAMLDIEKQHNVIATLCPPPHILNWTVLIVQLPFSFINTIRYDYPTLKQYHNYPNFSTKINRVKRTHCPAEYGRLHIMTNHCIIW